MSDNAYILFVKYPEAGKVKTRLAESLGAQKAAELYRALVERLVSSTDGDYDTLILIEPADRKADFIKWLGEGFRYVPQEGTDIGERMHNALRRAFEAGYKKAVLTGSDIPELNCGIINKAFELLAGNEAVIGGAEDGGYYLIGFNENTLNGEVFRGPDWSTDAVFEQTMRTLSELNIKTAQTVTLSDLDTADDFKKLRGRFSDIADRIGI